MTPEEERALERAVRMGIRNRMRPPRPRSGWPLVVLAVAVVLLFGIALWVAVPWQTRAVDPSDFEAVHALSQRFAARHPSVPGPPERYRTEARAEELDAPRTAAERLTRALALDPDDAEAWLHLVVLSARSQAVPELGPNDAQAVVDAVARTRSSAPLLPAARAWLHLQRDDPAAALGVLGEPTDEEPVDARWARLRATFATGGDLRAAARHLRAAAPAHPEGCEAASRTALSAGDLYEAEATATACLRAGVRRAALHRIRGEVSWLVGQPAAAARAWGEAGLRLHQIAALAASGQLDEAETVLDGELVGTWPTPLAVRAIWLGIQRGDRELVQQARGVVAETEARDPTLRQAWAAAELHLGNAGVAAGILEGLDDRLSLALRATATRSEEDVRAAFLATPTEPAVAALAASVLGPDAWRLVADVDPVVLALQRPLPDVDQPWGILGDTAPTPEGPAWAALLGAEGPVPDEPRPRDWRALHGPPCPSEASPLATAWCLRADPAAATEALTSHSAPGPGRDVLDALLVPGEAGDRALARIQEEQPKLAGLVVERYKRRVRAEGRTTTP